MEFSNAPIVPYVVHRILDMYADKAGDNKKALDSWSERLRATSNILTETNPPWVTPKTARQLKRWYGVPYAMRVCGKDAFSNVPSDLVFLHFVCCAVRIELGIPDNFESTKQRNNVDRILASMYKYNLPGDKQVEPMADLINEMEKYQMHSTQVEIVRRWACRSVTFVGRKGLENPPRDSRAASGYSTNAVPAVSAQKPKH